MTSLAVFGAGGHGRVVADTAEEVGWKKVYFYDDGMSPENLSGGWTIAGGFAQLLEDAPRYGGVIIGIGKNASRANYHRRLSSAGIVPTTILHPGAKVSRRAFVGAGSVVMAGAVIQAFARVGSGCIINTASSVDHDCELQDFVHVSPGAHLAGGVHVGEGVWIGLGATVREGITIGDRTIVGAGAAVVENLPADVLAVGVPARISTISPD